MLIQTPTDLGLLCREARQARGWTQATLAAALGATRQWVVDFERGKPTLALGLVLRALTVLGLALDVVPYEAAASTGAGSAATRADPALLRPPRA